MKKRRKIFLYILVCLLVIIIFSFYEYMTSPARIVQSGMTNIIKTKSNEYIKSISFSDETYNREDIYNFLVSLKGKKLNFEGGSDNEGAKNLYVYGIILNNQPIGVGIMNKGDFLIPKWEITRVYLW